MDSLPLSLADTRALTGSRGEIRNIVGVYRSGVKFEQEQSRDPMYRRRDAKQERPNIVV